MKEAVHGSKLHTPLQAAYFDYHCWKPLPPTLSFLSFTATHIQQVRQAFLLLPCFLDKEASSRRG